MKILNKLIPAEEVRQMIVSASEFKTNIGHYLSLVGKEEIIITRNGKRIARLVEDREDRLAIAESLIGVLPSTISKEQAKEERLRRHESLG